MESNINDEWITVVNNKKKKSYNTVIIHKTLEEINKIILDVLLKYKPYSIYIYGSRARKTNRPDSDIDLMVFWKKTIPEYDYLKNIKQELIDILQLNVDFVNMYITNKKNKVYDERDKCYYNNVIYDAICIYEIKSNNISDLIDLSIKLEKIE
jgi:predicted nucleotidyltransferase